MSPGQDETGKAAPPNNGSDERKFLHDLASPLAAAIYNLESILDWKQSKPGADPEEISQLVQALEALGQVRRLLTERREVLIKRGVPSARS